MPSNNILNSKKNLDALGSGADEEQEYKKGRGAQFNTKNQFEKTESTREHTEAIDDWTEPNIETQYIEVAAKSIVNKVDSKDVGIFYSMNQ